MTSGEIPSSDASQPANERRPFSSFLNALVTLLEHPVSFPALVEAQIENAGHEARRADKAELKADTDALTGLPNRRAFDIQLAKAIAGADRYPDRPVAVIMIDVDHFKNVNDTLGHLNGDEVLRTVGKVLQKHHRTEDTVARIGTEKSSGQDETIKHPARYGGEEFAVVLVGCSPENAKIIAQEIRHDIESSVTELPILTDGYTHHKVTASLGVASYDNEKDKDGASLVGRADAALYAAKQNGRNLVAAAGPSNIEIVPRDVPLARAPREETRTEFTSRPISPRF